MTGFPKIETDRLVLREIIASDAPALFAIHGDAQAMRWFGAEPLTEMVQAQRLVETFASWRQMPNPGVRWGIQSKVNGELVGSCGLFKWNRGWKSCVIGYELARVAWGNGFMTEALSAVLAWGFKHMELHRVEAQIHPENAASIRLVRHLGFIQEGHLREAGFWLGQYHDLLLYALLRREGLALPSSDQLQAALEADRS